MPLTLTVAEARRLAVASQLLAGKGPPATRRGILETVRALRRLQIDPTAAVAPSHHLVLWSRLGRYDPADLDTLVRKGDLFEYSAHLYPTEEYPIHAWRMRDFGRWWRGEGIWPRRLQDFMEKNRALRRQILIRLRREGPLHSRQFEGRAIVPWRSSGWFGGRNVSRMLEFLEWEGLIMVAGRREGQRLWDLPERVLPGAAPRERLSEREFSRRVAEGMLRAAGVVRARGDAWRWGHGRPRASALTELVREGRAEPVEVRDGRRTLPGRWYVSSDAPALLERLRKDAWRPHTTLLSPFDTLINDRERTEELFGFHFRLEIYVPKGKRQYGYFVLPILHGDRLIGRVSPMMLRDEKRLAVEAVYAEPDAPTDRATGRAVAEAIEELAGFLGAREITFGRTLPSAWKPAFHS